MLKVKFAGCAVVALLATSMMPPAAVAESPGTAEMQGQIAALASRFEASNPDFVAALRASGIDLPADVMGQVLGASEARGWARDQVVYQTPASEYGAFLYGLFKLYRERGALGLEQLKTLSGADLAQLVDQGILPSHAAYKKFNLLAFYASLREPSNVQWLLDQPKTNARAQERVAGVIAGISPQMRDDAAALLGASMAYAYALILADDQAAQAGLGVAGDAPLPPLPPAANGLADVRGAAQTAEGMAIEQVKYTLAGITPLVQDVKLTSMNELTLVVEQLTSLTQVFETLTQYYYEYNYYYHYENLQWFWWLYDYRVDHFEQVDRVQWEQYVQDTYHMTEYVYQYQDLISVRGLVSGVLGLDYQQALPAMPVSVGALPGAGLLDETEHTPEVQLLLDFVMPFTFDVTDELSLYFLEELVHHVIQYVQNVYHYYWEYHIRNYWRWDPLDDISLPFASASLSGASDYLVSVEEDLDVGKVLNVIPVANLYSEATISLLAPASEYPLLDQGAVLQPAPVSFLPSQIPAGETGRSVADVLHVSPAPNVFDARADALPLTDHVLGLAHAEQTAASAELGAVNAALGAGYGNPAALYTLIPSQIRVDLPSTDLPGVDAGAGAMQVVGWTTQALPGFIPQFAYAGLRAADSAGAAHPVLVNVDARGLGAPVTFALRLNGALSADAQALGAQALGGGVPVGISGDTPVGGPVGAYVRDLGTWAGSLLGWLPYL